jgi:hypothetical protein
MSDRDPFTCTVARLASFRLNWRKLRRRRAPKIRRIDDGEVREPFRRYYSGLRFYGLTDGLIKGYRGKRFNARSGEKRLDCWRGLLAYEFR